MQHKMKRYSWEGDFNEQAPKEEAEGWDVVSMVPAKEGHVLVLWAREEPLVIRSHADVVLERAKRQCPNCFAAGHCIGDPNQSVEQCHNLPE